MIPMLRWALSGCRRTQSLRRIFRISLSLLSYPALGCKDDGRTCTRPASESPLRPLSCRVANDLSESPLKKGVLTSVSYARGQLISPCHYFSAVGV